MGKWGIPLTGVTTTYSVSGYAGVSRDADGVREAVFAGRSLPRVPVSAPVARGVLVSTVWPRESLADGRGVVSVRELRLQGLRDSRNGFPGDQETTCCPTIIAQAVLPQDAVD